MTNEQLEAGVERAQQHAMRLQAAGYSPLLALKIALLQRDAEVVAAEQPDFRAIEHTLVLKGFEVGVEKP